MSATTLRELATRARTCTLCAAELSHGVRPVFQVGVGASVLVVGQAPGAKVHETGVPFDDPSGDRLREWMGVDRAVFYDSERVALLPMGFCYPGKGTSGDLPPIPLCAETWRQPFMELLSNVKLTLVVGQYAQQWHLPKREKNLTETVRSWRNYGAQVVPLPHPSPRNNIWLKKNPWFEQELLPDLRGRVSVALGNERR